MPFLLGLVLFPADYHHTNFLSGSGSLTLPLFASAPNSLLLSPFLRIPPPNRNWPLIILSTTQHNLTNIIYMDALVILAGSIIVQFFTFWFRLLHNSIWFASLIILLPRFVPKVLRKSRFPKPTSRCFVLLTISYSPIVIGYYLWPSLDYWRDGSCKPPIHAPYSY
ncbi:hypothetical protein F4774DRAFT_112865 [Daldinia eschscholtzii]|nr:hypothetical protein F4774DRAFT_112865 [Daldinia eschscholtzii]